MEVSRKDQVYLVPSALLKDKELNAKNLETQMNDKHQLGWKVMLKPAALGIMAMMARRTFCKMRMRKMSALMMLTKMLNA